MKRIRILPDNLVNQIAAGEVVERPASVIKELVENAIDAGARRIAVDIELGGRRLMRVADDGHGMTRDDSILAFERHATSKISTQEDLGAIATLGFRGEALASIASVAKVELVTKQEQDLAATIVLIEGGRLVDVKDAARDTGTTISVRDLFFNTPARRKFMRSEATENYHLAGIVTHYALAHPEIAFTMTSNSREILRAAPAKDLRERAFQIFGRGIFDSLLPVSGGREYVAKVSGFVSAPRERRTNRDSQYFFVNNRFVRDKIITRGLSEGYRSVLPHGVYPVAFLFVELPLDEIDVNVHPAKTEVRFRRGEAVKDMVAEAVRDALAKAGVAASPAETPAPMAPLHENESAAAAAAAAPAAPVPEPEQHAMAFDVGQGGDVSSDVPAATRVAYESPRRMDLEEAGAAVEEPGNIAFDFEQLAQERVAEADPATPIPLATSPVLPPVNSASHLAKPAEVDDLSAGKIRPLGQLHDSFVIAVDDEGLLLVDQHVAHERILFDKFRKKEIDRNPESQNLLLPETIDLSPAQAQAFEMVEEELAAIGFGLMRLSGRTVAIKAIPTDLPPSEVRNLFAEILDNVDREKRGSGRSSIRDDIAASLACKAAVKINMKLTQEKMVWLIDRLLTTSSPTTCPHGRPVILRLAIKDIERGFHRT